MCTHVHVCETRIGEWLLHTCVCHQFNRKGEEGEMNAVGVSQITHLM